MQRLKMNIELNIDVKKGNSLDFWAIFMVARYKNYTNVMHAFL